METHNKRVLYYHNIRHTTIQERGNEILKENEETVPQLTHDHTVVDTYHIEYCVCVCVCVCVFNPSEGIIFQNGSFDT